MRVDLLIIDPQEDFCNPNGTLFVKGADQDMIRLSEFINKNKEQINNIRVTLDSHHYIHIAHPIWWQDQNGNSPNPFTIITSKDVTEENPKWKSRSPLFAKRSIDYVKKLEAIGKVLCIWPYHCLIGSAGHAISDLLFNSLQNWEKQHFNIIDKIVKGTNIYTEQYSALKAEIIDENDPDTNLNIDLIEKLKEPDLILVVGEASSHCVAETIKNAIEHIKPNKFVLLTDAMSSVTGFEKLSEDFFAEMKLRGMKFAKTSDFLFE